MKQRRPLISFYSIVDNPVFDYRIYVVVSNVDQFWDVIIYSESLVDLERSIKILQNSGLITEFSILPHKRNVFKSPMSVIESFTSKSPATKLAKQIVKCLEHYYEVEDE